MRKHLLLVLLLVCSIVLYAQNIKTDGVVYKIKDGSAYIIDYDCEAVKAVISGKVEYKGKHYEVKKVNWPEKIKYNKSHLKLKKLVFAPSCSMIYEDVANGVETLESVDIQGSVTMIGSSAFSGCKRLTDIVLPESLVEIQSSAFANCVALQKIILPKLLEKLGSDCFSGTGLKELVIPSGVFSMSHGILSRCNSLEKVIFLNRPHEIGINFFWMCKSLKSVVIPNTVTKIDKNAFAGCENLKDIVLPNQAVYFTESDAKIGDVFGVYHATFAGCINLTNVKCHNGAIPNDFAKYLPQECPYVKNGEQSTNSSFDQPLLTAVEEARQEYREVGQMYAQIIKSDVDQDVPISGVEHAETYALIIGNEHYADVPSVPYAEHDARVFAEYCNKVLGLPEKNITTCMNATYAELLAAVKRIKSISDAHGGDISIVFYYTGHGIPDESSHEAYLLPTDADGTMTEVCYGVNELCKDLALTGAKSITMMLDASFNGTQRNGNVLQAMSRGVAIKAKPIVAENKIVVLKAAGENESAYMMKNKSHGLFTYFLLKKLKETKGDITIGELTEYIRNEVAASAIIQYKRSQTVNTVIAPALKASWQNVKMR